MDQLGQLLVGLMGGGLVALIPVIVKAFRSFQEGRLAKEDTTISKWKEYSKFQSDSAESAWTAVGAFRKWYHRLWAQYVRITGDDETYPSDPVMYEKEQRKGEKDDEERDDEPPEAK